MDQDTKEIVASNLTQAFYASVERRKGYLGPERRQSDDLLEGQRDLRQNSVTPGEVHRTYEMILGLLGPK